MFHQTKSCTYPDSMKEQISTAYWHEKLKQLGIIVIIPSYNNGKTLADVIESVRFYAPDILVVNDGSTDETAEILSRESNLHTITHPVNQGKGVALRHGLSFAKKQGFRYAITIDSDGQHFASDIPALIEAIEKEPDTLLVGAGITDKLRELGELQIRTICRERIHLPISFPTSGLPSKQVSNCKILNPATACTPSNE